MISSELSVLEGLYQPYLSSGCGPSHSTATPSGAARSGFERVPTLRKNRSFPQMVLTMMSESPSPSQSATERHVYPHFASPGPCIEPLYPAIMRNGDVETTPPSDGNPREVSTAPHDRYTGSAHFGYATPGPLKFSMNAIYPAELPQIMSISPSPSQSVPAGVASIPQCTLSASPRR